MKCYLSEKGKRSVISCLENLSPKQACYKAKHLAQVFKEKKSVFKSKRTDTTMKNLTNASKKRSENGWQTSVALVIPQQSKPGQSLNTKARLLGIALFILITALCFSAIKAGLAFAPPLLFGGLRVLIAGLTLLGLLFVLRRPLFPNRQHWPGLLVLALVATTFTFGVMFLSPSLTAVGVASVLGNTQPLITVVLAAIFLAERLTKGKFLALVLGIIGVGLIAYQGLITSNAYSTLGAVLALTASVGSSAASIIFKRMKVSEADLLGLIAWQLILGSLPLLIFGVTIEFNQKINWSLEFIGLLLFLALIGTAFVTVLWYWLVQRGDVGQLTIFLFLVPVLGLGLSALFFNEPLNLLEGSGIFLIIGAMLLNFKSSPPPNPTLASQINFKK